MIDYAQTLLWVCIALFIIALLAYLWLPGEKHRTQRLEESLREDMSPLRLTFENWKSRKYQEFETNVAAEWRLNHGIAYERYMYMRHLELFDAQFLVMLERNITDLIKERGLQAAQIFASHKGLTQDQFFTLLTIIYGGRFGETMANIQERRELADIDLYKDRKGAEDRVEVNIKMDDWKRKKMQQFMEDDDDEE